MRCREYIKYLSPYIDSELDARTCVEIGDHLEVCPSCRRRFAREQEIERLMAEKLKGGQMPEHLWKAVRTRIRAAERAREYVPDTTTAGSRIGLKWLVPVIASVILALGLSIFFFWARAPQEDRNLVLALEGVHDSYLKDEISVGSGIVWPEDFKQMSILGRIPQSENIGGHGVELVGGRPYHLKNNVEVAFLEYRCCGEPVTVFILRKKDLDNFPQTRDLLDRNKGLTKMAFGDRKLMIMDMGEAVVCGVSCHEINTLLQAFERV